MFCWCCSIFPCVNSSSNSKESFYCIQNVTCATLRNFDSTNSKLPNSEVVYHHARAHFKRNLKKIFTSTKSSNVFSDNFSAKSNTLPPCTDQYHDYAQATLLSFKPYWLTWQFPLTCLMILFIQCGAHLVRIGFIRLWNQAFTLVGRF